LSARSTATDVGIGRPARRAARRLLALLWTMASLGCAEQQAFRPTERVTARSASGQLAAEYELEAPTGEDVGEVKVWSSGARDDDESDATLVHVGFEVENEASGPMTIDPKKVYLDSVSYDDTTVRKVAPARTGGDHVVPPGSASQINVYFLLRGVDPTDITGFRVRWTVASGPHRVSEYTPFIKARTIGAPYYYPPYYDPFYYPGPYYYYRPAIIYRRPYHRTR
jgi:hypothetical protein